jgi:hypothetical protein
MKPLLQFMSEVSMVLIIDNQGDLTLEQQPPIQAFLSRSDSSNTLVTFEKGSIKLCIAYCTTRLYFTS